MALLTWPRPLTDDPACMTHRALFLDRIERLLPWETLIQQLIDAGVAEDHFPAGLNTHLRIHCLQQWFTYTDPAVEEALYEIPLFCAFCGTETSVEGKRINEFRDTLDGLGLLDSLHDRVNQTLQAAGLTLKPGRVEDPVLLRDPVAAGLADPLALSPRPETSVPMERA
ncbi:transposase [Thioalkalivibrio sp. ALMg3]|uniref:transposase n=1 Tax=Thioalkalivibrio sp. ALMg3 TaxID=1158163 RepID=UPI00036C7BCF|nr:transposase [Thioalkalivibrio sp. ALMg3]